MVWIVQEVDWESLFPSFPCLPQSVTFPLWKIALAWCLVVEEPPCLVMDSPSEPEMFSLLSEGFLTKSFGDSNLVELTMARSWELFLLSRFPREELVGSSPLFSERGAFQGSILRWPEFAPGCRHSSNISSGCLSLYLLKFWKLH